MVDVADKGPIVQAMWRFIDEKAELDTMPSYLAVEMLAAIGRHPRQMISAQEFIAYFDAAHAHQLCLEVGVGGSPAKIDEQAWKAIPTMVRYTCPDEFSGAIFDVYRETMDERLEQRAATGLNFSTREDITDWLEL